MTRTQIPSRAASSVVNLAVEAEIHVMIPRSTKQPGRPDEASQPLLYDDEDDEDLLFSAAEEGSDDDIEVPARLPDPPTSKPSGRSVRFEEDVQVIVPSLRSTTASREAGSYTAGIVNCTSLRWPRIRPRLRRSRGRDLCSKRSR